MHVPVASVAQPGAQVHTPVPAVPLLHVPCPHGTHASQAGPKWLASHTQPFKLPLVAAVHPAAASQTSQARPAQPGKHAHTPLPSEPASQLAAAHPALHGRQSAPNVFGGHSIAVGTLKKAGLGTCRAGCEGLAKGCTGAWSAC